MQELEASVHSANRKEDDTHGPQRARGTEAEEAGEAAENAGNGSLIVSCWDFVFYSERHGRPRRFWSEESHDLTTMFFTC